MVRAVAEALQNEHVDSKHADDIPRLQVTTIRANEDRRHNRIGFTMFVAGAKGFVRNAYICEAGAGMEPSVKKR